MICLTSLDYQGLVFIHVLNQSVYLPSEQTNLSTIEEVGGSVTASPFFYVRLYISPEKRISRTGYYNALSGVSKFSKVSLEGKRTEY